MKSFLINYQDKTKLENYIEEYLKSNKINKFDAAVFMNDKKSKDKITGIDLVRSIKKTAYLAPSMSTQKALIIKNIEEFSVPAQNALLKLIEEPSISTHIIISTKNLNRVLETIISRCFVINLRSNSYKDLSEKDIEKLDKILLEIKEYDPLMLSEFISKSENKLEITSYLLFNLQNKMFKAIEDSDLDSLSFYKDLITKLQEGYHLFFKDNLNHRNNLDSIFLSSS